MTPTLRTLRNLPETHPLVLYEKANQDETFQTGAGGTKGWIWLDKYLENDFNRIAPPDTSNLSSQILELRAFYMLYLGLFKNATNVGALMARILANCESFDGGKEKILKFNTEGTTPFPIYHVPSGLDAVYQDFILRGHKVETDNDIYYNRVPPPAEPRTAELVDEMESPARLIAASDATQAVVSIVLKADDINTFIDNVRDKFKELESSTPSILNPSAGEKDKEGEGSGSEKGLAALKALNQTAVFLILVLMRRITKRDSDLIMAFQRPNIHRHYNDMIPEPLGLAIPPPSEILNMIAPSVFSVNTLAGRILGTMLMALKNQCKTTTTDAPVGFLDQQHSGLESLLLATCMTHIAGAGLQLITLFLAVRAVYGKGEREALHWLSYDQFEASISRIVSLRTDQHNIKEGESVRLFPYCKLVHQQYHTDLGAKGNEHICYFMSCLIDMRCPPAPGTGGAMKALWTQKLSEELKMKIEKAAKKISSGDLQFNLTPVFPEQIPYRDGEDQGETGTTWRAPGENTRPGSNISRIPDADQWDEDDAM